MPGALGYAESSWGHRAALGEPMWVLGWEPPWSHPRMVAHVDHTLAMAVPGDADDRLCSSRWQLVQLGWLALGQSAVQVASQSSGGFTVTPHPAQPSNSRLGTAGRRNWRVSGGWVTTLAAPAHD